MKSKHRRGRGRGKGAVKNDDTLVIEGCLEKQKCTLWTHERCQAIDLLFQAQCVHTSYSCQLIKFTKNSQSH